jgi:hypothetical protein
MEGAARPESASMGERKGLTGGVHLQREKRENTTSLKK